ncbi:MAG: hypothetical protein ACRDJC_21285 [Thermomicrobiales bacterium]
MSGERLDGELACVGNRCEPFLSEDGVPRRTRATGESEQPAQATWPRW